MAGEEKNSSKWPINALPCCSVKLHHTSCSIRGALVLEHSIGDALRGKRVSEEKWCHGWRCSEFQKKSRKLEKTTDKGRTITIAKAMQFIARVGRLSKAEENCAVVAICHSYYINSVVYLSWGSRTGSTVPIVFVTWKFTRDKNKSWQVDQLWPWPFLHPVGAQGLVAPSSLCCVMLMLPGKDGSTWESWVTSRHELGLNMSTSDSLFLTPV